MWELESIRPQCTITSQLRWRKVYWNVKEKRGISSRSHRRAKCDRYQTFGILNIDETDKATDIEVIIRIFCKSVVVDQEVGKFLVSPCPNFSIFFIKAFTRRPLHRSASYVLSVQFQSIDQTQRIPDRLSHCYRPVRPEASSWTARTRAFRTLN